ncbi:hypothetical protein GCM10012275_43690 [Longimycelium tulufanense]|uniref:Uncharacterized protein n=1 Tax=Longimycelium tulufanense TaxID=907463 RepID=A0A8J3CB58_9PSEU|nr:hypothetical protein [Longimycelium tulufanense]GGM68452.1 hypothetical protein GCM10012275_43690 [Longimycelium tulufanense]
MGFSEAQFQAAVDKINAGLRDLSSKIEQVRPAAEAAANQWYVPDVVKDAVLWLAEKAISLAKSVWNKIVEVLKGVAAPVWFFKYAFDWADVKGLATDVAGQLKPEAMTGTQRWHGEAAEAYRKHITPQGQAAARIGTLADKISIALGICATAGLAFYVSIGVILAKFIVAMVGIIASLGSVAFSWVGVGLAVEEASVNTGFIIAAVSTLTAALGAQAQQLVALHSEAVDNNTFPGGTWPNPVTTTYNDASVKDGTARWSMAQ